MIQQGQVFKLKTKGPDGQPLWVYRYRLEGRRSERPQVGGFATRTEAEKALRKVIDRLGPGGGRTTITLGEFADEYLEMHQAAPATITKLRWLLGKATAALGEKRLADLSPREVYAWRMTVPEGHRFEATQALRQVLNRAVAWGLLDYNPAKLGVPNPPRRAKEKRPFETWQQIEAVSAGLGPVYAPMVILAAATGLRPSELFGLDTRDVDRQLGVVYVRRAYANGRLKHTKTRLSTVSRFMGTSIAMIDRHYGHLANESRDHAVALLDALALERAVDAARTSTKAPRKPIRRTVSGSRAHRPRRRLDARWTPRLVPVA